MANFGAHFWHRFVTESQKFILRVLIKLWFLTNNSKFDWFSVTYSTFNGVFLCFLFPIMQCQDSFPLLSFSYNVMPGQLSSSAFQHYILLTATFLCFLLFPTSRGRFSLLSCTFSYWLFSAPLHFILLSVTLLLNFLWILSASVNFVIFSACLNFVLLSTVLLLHLILSSFPLLSIISIYLSLLPATFLCSPTHHSAFSSLPLLTSTSILTHHLLLPLPLLPLLLPSVSSNHFSNKWNAFHRLK